MPTARRPGGSFRPRSPASRSSTRGITRSARTSGLSGSSPPRPSTRRRYTNRLVYGVDMATKRPIRMRVHEKGHPRLDSVLRLVDSASQARPLGELLGMLCEELAQVMQVQVVSVYVREQDPDS